MPYTTGTRAIATWLFARKKENAFPNTNSTSKSIFSSLSLLPPATLLAYFTAVLPIILSSPVAENNPINMLITNISCRPELANGSLTSEVVITPKNTITGATAT